MKNFIYNSLFSYQKYGLKIAYKRNKEVSKMWEDLSVSIRSIPYQPVLTRLQALGLDLNNIGSITEFWDAEKVKHEIKKFLKKSKSFDIRWYWFEDLTNKDKCTWVDIGGCNYNYGMIQKPKIARKREIKKLILKTFKEKVKDETKVIIFEHLDVIHISFMDSQACLIIISFFPKKRGV